MPFLQSISNFFSGNPANSSSSRVANRRSVMNSTLDAFTLPTVHGENGMRYPGNYADGGLPQADSASSSPGPSRRGSTAYGVYPTSKDAFPGSSGSANYYPPPTHTFHRLRNTLANSFPELLETLNGPANPHMLAAFEAELGCTLPRAVRESLLVVDGQDLESTGNIAGSGGLFYGLHLLPLEEVMREWAFWRQAEQDPMAGNNAAVLATMASVPPNWIKKLYACRGWIPLLSDRTGNYVGVDLDPGASGAWGQVIVFGRDFDRKCVLWRGDGEGGWGKWLASFVEELESGEGWEADKASVSDEEEEVGYDSYNGGGTFGEAGQGLRLAGEYRGWNVLEAWWDRSVRKWETLGMGLDVDEVEKGMDEARRLAGYEPDAHVEDKGKGKGKATESLGIGMRVGESSAQVDIPVVGSPHLPPAPGTPVPHDSDALLPPASPDQPPIPKIRHPKPPPVRVITPINSTTDHPLKATTSPSGYLSPPSRSPPRNRRREPAPAPTPLDLPTRADVQATAAIAQAERSGLRGGWVMNLDTSAGAASRRASRVDPEPEMVNIDLEGGKVERFGSPRMSDADMERQREEEKLALAGLEHRRSPVLIQSRAPSPLSREASFDESNPDKTPRAAPRVPDGLITVPPSVIAATSAIRRPPPAANHSDLSIRTFTSAEEERDRPIIRGARSAPLARSEREASIISTDSQDGLLESRTNRSPSPVPSSIMSGDVATSPTTINMSRTNSEAGADDLRLASPLVNAGRKGSAGKKERGLEEELEEISLDAPPVSAPAALQ